MNSAPIVEIAFTLYLILTFAHFAFFGVLCARPWPIGARLFCTVGQVASALAAIDEPSVGGARFAFLLAASVSLVLAAYLVVRVAIEMARREITALGRPVSSVATPAPVANSPPVAPEANPVADPAEIATDGEAARIDQIARAYGGAVRRSPTKSR